MSAAVGDARRHPRREAPATLRLYVKLEGVFPPVWRRIEVASDLGLDDLHDVLQVVFGWEDRHLYRYSTGPEQEPGAAFACVWDLAEEWHEDSCAMPTWNVRTEELLATVGERLYQQYDYGDNWWLAIEVEEVDEGRVPPGRAVLLEGAGAGPPEDCGGIDGYRMIVPAADPTHPDHRQALADLRDWWGIEPTPDALGLVAFDPFALGEQLRALDLAGRPPTPRHVGAKLVELLLRARNSDTARRLRDLASAADAPADVDEARAADMVRALQVLLDTVGDGVKLTAAGSLPPRVVRTVCDELDLDRVWIGAGNREDQTVPVLVLRQTAQRLGVLRKVKGRLVPTARGRALAGDPVGLWWRLAGALPLGGRDASDAARQAGVLLLGLMAAGSTDDAEVAVAELLTGLRWELEGGQPIDRRTAIGLIADDVALLRRVGALDGDGFEHWPGAVTPGGRALARAALADR